jgi:OOP family OmpA-OmpF porin
MKAVSAAIEPAVASPYTWQGERSGKNIVLSGYVPSAADREEVRAAARVAFAGETIDDRIRVAAGEPRMDWIGAIKFALEQLGKLENGKVVVGDKSYAIDGEAQSAEAYAEVLEANGKTLPASLVLQSGEVTPPRVASYQFVAERRPGGVTMSGHVANEADRDAIFAAAKRKLGSVEVAGDIMFASGAPEGFAEAAEVLLQVLGRMSGGRVAITDKTVTIDGLVYQPGALEEIAELLATGLPKGFTLAANNLAERQQGQPLTPERCRDQLQAVLQSGRIAFDGTQAEIATDSIGVLDRVSATLARCPEAAIEVGAHSDSEGSSARNRDRTQARAEAIVDFLVAAGIRRERLVAIGYGETKPVGDNSTDAGKAANRRIEFSVEAPGG